MKIKPKDEYTYLFNKSRAYHLGWEFCVGGKDALTKNLTKGMATAMPMVKVSLKHLIMLKVFNKTINQ